MLGNDLFLGGVREFMRILLISAVSVALLSACNFKVGQNLGALHESDYVTNLNEEKIGNAQRSLRMPAYVSLMVPPSCPETSAAATSVQEEAKAGVEQTQREVKQILNRLATATAEQNNVILRGEPGIDTGARVYALIQRLHNAGVMRKADKTADVNSLCDIPKGIAWTRKVVELRLDKLHHEAKERQWTQAYYVEFLKRVLDDNQNNIVFIRDVDRFVYGEKDREKKDKLDIEISDLLNIALRHKAPVILGMTETSYQHLIVEPRDKAVANRVIGVQLHPIGAEELKAYLMAEMEPTSRQYGVELSEEVVDDVVRLVRAFLPAEGALAFGVRFLDDIAKKGRDDERVKRALAVLKDPVAVSSGNNRVLIEHARQDIAAVIAPEIVKKLGNAGTRIGERAIKESPVLIGETERTAEFGRARFDRAVSLGDIDDNVHLLPEWYAENLRIETLERPEHERAVEAIYNRLSADIAKSADEIHAHIDNLDERIARQFKSAANKLYALRVKLNHVNELTMAQAVAIRELSELTGKIATTVEKLDANEQARAAAAAQQLAALAEATASIKALNEWEEDHPTEKETVVLQENPLDPSRRVTIERPRKVKVYLKDKLAELNRQNAAIKANVDTLMSAPPAEITTKLDKLIKMATAGEVSVKGLEWQSQLAGAQQKADAAFTRASSGKDKLWAATLRSKIDYLARNVYVIGRYPEAADAQAIRALEPGFLVLEDIESKLERNASDSAFAAQFTHLSSVISLPLLAIQTKALDGLLQQLTELKGAVPAAVGAAIADSRVRCIQKIDAMHGLATLMNSNKRFDLADLGQFKLKMLPLQNYVDALKKFGQPGAATPETINMGQYAAMSSVVDSFDREARLHMTVLGNAAGSIKAHLNGLRHDLSELLTTGFSVTTKTPGYFWGEYTTIQQKVLPVALRESVERMRDVTWLLARIMQQNTSYKGFVESKISELNSLINLIKTEQPVATVQAGITTLENGLKYW